MDYIITDFQGIENLDYKNSAKIVENLKVNSALFMDKIAENLNDSSNDLKFKIFLKEEADTLYNTWKTLKESKNIKNVEVKDLFVNSYRHTYKCLEIKYGTLIKDVFKPIFDAFPDNEKYIRERSWNKFSNINNTQPLKSRFIKKSNKPKWEYVFELMLDGSIVVSINNSNLIFCFDGITFKNKTALGEKLSETLGISSLRPFFTDSVGHGSSKGVFTEEHKVRIKEIMEKSENKMCDYFQKKVEVLLQ